MEVQIQRLLSSLTDRLQGTGPFLQLLEHRFPGTFVMLARLEHLILIEEVPGHLNHHALHHWHHFQCRYQLFRELRRAQTTGYATVAHKPARLVVPLGVHVIQRVCEGGGRAIVILGDNVNVRISCIDAF